MKKLMIAAASAAMVAGAYADDLVPGLYGFEAGDFVSEIGDGQWSNTNGVSSKAYGSETPASVGSQVPGTNYMDIETEDGPLTRLFADPTSLDYKTGTIDPNNVYVDTAVKFTAAEEAPAIESGAKFALWLKADDTTTNLMVTCASVGSTGLVTPTNIAVKAKASITPETWHRVSIRSILDTKSGKGFGCFLLRIDDELVSAVDYTGVFPYGYTDWLSTENQTYAENKQLFPSMVGVQSGLEAAQLTSLGFQGKGAIDMLKITTQDPYYIETTGITLDKAELALKVGANETLVATVAPDNATDKTVTWTSDNEGVATVDDGVVTAVAAGTATIRATTVDGFDATCTVTVTADVEPIDPTQPKTYKTEEQATAAANNINANKAAYIQKPFKEMTDEQKATYDTYVKAVASGTSVTFEFSEAGETAAQESVDDAVKVSDITDTSKVEATVNAIPGFYYEIVGDTDVAGTYGTGGGSEQATGTTVKLTKPTLGETTKGFYKVQITPTKPAN